MIHHLIFMPITISVIVILAIGSTIGPISHFLH